MQDLEENNDNAAGTGFNFLDPATASSQFSKPACYDASDKIDPIVYSTTTGFIHAVADHTRQPLNMENVTLSLTKLSTNQ